MPRVFRITSALALLLAMPAALAAQGPRLPGSGLCVDAVLSTPFTTCWNPTPGNDRASAVLPKLDGLNVGSWHLVAKSDEANDMFSADYTSGRFGAFDFDTSLLSPFAISFKHGNYFQLYYFAGVPDVHNLAWDLRPVIGDRGPYGELSHASLWAVERSAVVIPEPASGVLLIVGLAGLGLAVRRRSVRNG